MADVPFYLVWAEDGGEPRMKQPDLPTAQRECDRLARLHPGDRFFVLVPVCSSRRSDIQRETYAVRDALFDDGLPF